MDKSKAQIEQPSSRRQILNRLRVDAAEMTLQSYCGRCGWLAGYGCACDTSPEIVMLNRQTKHSDGSAPERIARILEPGAWAEVDTGEASWSDDATCRQSLAAGERLLRAFPALLGLMG